jgi:hypothetical protein
MKRLLLLLTIAITLFQYVTAQNTTDEYIEIIVEDTLLVIPQNITYLIQIKKELKYERYPDTSLSYEGQSPFDTTEASKSNLQILSLIKKMKIDTSYAFLPTNYVERNDQNTVFKKYKLHFNTYVTFLTFLQETASITNAECFILSMSHSKIRSFEEKLLSKLLTDGVNKAKFIGSSVRRPVGKILQIKEIQEEIEGKWTAYPPLSFLVSNLQEDKIILHKKLIIRFAW